MQTENKIFKTILEAIHCPLNCLRNIWSVLFGRILAITPFESSIKMYNIILLLSCYSFRKAHLFVLISLRYILQFYLEGTLLSSYWQRVNIRMTKGWRRVCRGLMEGWQRVGRQRVCRQRVDGGLGRGLTEG